MPPVGHAKRLLETKKAREATSDLTIAMRQGRDNYVRAVHGVIPQAIDDGWIGRLPLRCHIENSGGMRGGSGKARSAADSAGTGSHPVPRWL
jgi:hypothetical protein